MVGSASANYDIFSLRKFAELPRTRAELESAEAGELEQRFQAALETESSYYDVLVNQELVSVAEERVLRAEEGLKVARARVASGAAVQTDSLQLVLELTRAQVEVLRQRNALGTARYELGRRVGAAGPMDAVPLDTTPAPPLPISMAEAVSIGLDQGPQYRAAQASERSAEANLKAQKSDYLPDPEHRWAAPTLRHRDLSRRVEHQLGDVRPVVPAVEQRPARDRGEPRPGQSRRGARDPRGPGAGRPP